MQPGTRLGSYEIVELLGKGGMGEVYRAHDPNLGRDVAIKVLPEALSADAERLARLRREARALAALNHPHIATIHDLEEEGGRTFIVMELLEGPTLAEKLREGPLPVDDAIEIARQVAGALEAAHRNELVHRDLKPDNIKLTAEGHAKVLDFGLAKKRIPGPDDAAGSVLPTQTVEPTSTGVVMGTPAYMSPEQIRAGDVDERTDVWAFGCLLFEMLTGQRPFGRETPSDTMAAVLHEPVPEERLPVGVPPSVRQLVHHALTKDPERRPGSMRDARVTLEQTQHDSAGRRAVELTQRRRLPGRSLVAALGVLALVVLLAGWYFLSPVAVEMITDRSIAVLPFETLGQSEPTLFTEGVHVDMLTRLSRMPELSVTSRTSVMRYRDTDRPLPEIAAELGVAWVLLGEVQEVANRVQVNARLVNAVEDEQVWAQTYRRELTAENLFEIQGELAERIGDQLQAHLTDEQRATANSVPTRDLEAYRLYVQGRELLNRRGDEEMRAAVEYFERATGRDADYALAWVGLADALALLESYGHAPHENLIPRGFEAVDRALEIAPNLGEAHASRGLLLAESEDPEPGEAFGELQRAIELRPSYAEAHNWMAWGALLQGHPERAHESAARAVELDPLSLEAVSNLALAEIALGRYEEGAEEARGLRAIGPGYATGRFYEALARLHLGDPESAIELLDGMELPWAGSGPLGTLAVAHARAGDTEAATRVLERLEESGHPFDLALAHAALGNEPAAWTALQRIDEWPPWPRLGARYLFPETLDPFRADPRWDDLAPPRLELEPVNDP